MASFTRLGCLLSNLTTLSREEGRQSGKDKLAHFRSGTRIEESSEEDAVEGPAREGPATGRAMVIMGSGERRSGDIANKWSVRVEDLGERKVE